MKTLCSSPPQTDEETAVRRWRAHLIKRIFAMGKELHGEQCMNPDELKEEIHQDIMRMKIARPQIGPDGRKKLISIMTLGQLKELVYEYRMMLGRRPYNDPGHTHSPLAPITHRQQKFILDLCQEMNWNVRRLAHFSSQVVKKFYPQTRSEAGKLIEGLKAMKEKGYSYHRDAEDTEEKL